MAPGLLSVVCSFHDDKAAAVCVSGNCSDSFTVRNEDFQGCILAPVFLICTYFCAVLMIGGSFLSGFSDTYIHMYIRMLVSDQIKSHLLQSCITESKFADAAALYLTYF